MANEYTRKLILLRGNSGSGKSTVAKKLRELAKKQEKIALVEQDYLRRIVLKEKEKEGGDNIDLIKDVVIYGLSRGYHVILEGIFYSGRYFSMLKQLLEVTPNHYVYYFDISFEETLKRHQTKPNSSEFGETEMRSWYKEKDLLCVEGEVVIKESSSLENTINRILDDTGI